MFWTIFSLGAPVVFCAISRLVRTVKIKQPQRRRQSAKPVSWTNEFAFFQTLDPPYPLLPSEIGFLLTPSHPRRPRGSQSGREKGRDESFQVRAKEPLGTDSHRTISKIQEEAGSWLGTKNALYNCAQSANSFSWVLFVSSYTTAFVSITACLARAPKKCTQSGNFKFDIKSPSDFKILSARRLKTLFQKYKLELTTGIHACIGHVLRKY